MKLKKVKIENFKRIDELEIDFRDTLGRVLDFTVLAGPNGCGKTTVLDAIAYPLYTMMEMPFPFHRPAKNDKKSCSLGRGFAKRREKTSQASAAGKTISAD